MTTRPPNRETQSISKRRHIVAVLDNIRSLYNVGSIFRTADALGVTRLYLCGLTGRPDDELNRTRIHKTALGAEETVPWTYVEDVVDVTKQLKQEDFTILALEQTPTALDLFKTYTSTSVPPGRIALIVGHEVYGTSERALRLADQHVQIPMLGTKESLNVSVAFGIAVALLGNPQA